MGTFDSYTKVNDLEASDTLLVETGNGTRGITGEHLMKSGSRLLSGDEYYDLLDQFAPVEVRRNTFRGKSLGTSFTAAQKATIADGSFKGYFLGDYWEIDGNIWRIADFDYWLKTDRDSSLNTHHIIIVPDNPVVVSMALDTSQSSAGGYTRTLFYTNNLESIRDTIKNIFGSGNLLTHVSYFPRTIASDGTPSGGSWFNSDVDLMSEIMVYGSNIFNKPFYTIEKTQLALFKQNPVWIVKGRYSYWLRDALEDNSFSAVYYAGTAHKDYPTREFSIRPVFGITGGESA